MTDSEIVKGCQLGNMKAQKALYDRYSRVVMGICVRYVRNQADAQDVFQDTFVKIFRSVQTIENPEFLSLWLRRIAVNTAINFLKQKKRYPISSLDNLELKSNERTDELLDTEQMLKALDELHEPYRLIFNLYVIEGYSHKEISELIGINEGTSKSQLSRAKALLRKIIFKTEQV
jgi:RNA polymerase sigma-70 factor (ECF subfamily)